MAKGKFSKISKVNLSELDENHSLSEMINEEEEKTVAEGPRVSDKIADPVGRNYSIDSEITEAELRSFLISHAYRQPMSYILMLMGIAFGVYLSVSGQGVAIGVLVSVLIVIYYPITLCLKAKKIKNKNKTFGEIFHYMLDEKGCHLQLEKEAIDVEWKYFQKAVYNKNCVVIYTNAKHGYIIPTKDMGSQKEEILEFLKEKISK